MLKLMKFLFFFLLYGTIWFFIFSIPLNKEGDLFLALKNTLNYTPAKEKNENKNRKEINREKVIDALTNAFKPE